MRRSSRSTWSWGSLLSTALLGSQAVNAIDISLDDPNSLKEAAKTAADGLLSYYTGDQPGDVPGNLPDPYYWWECGAMFGTLIDYWYYTGDDEYNEKTTQALLHQVGPLENYEPPNQTRALGNDDQAFWGMAVLSATEYAFPNPPEDKPQWLALSQAVFNSQAGRWNNETCGGGLNWQVIPYNRGYNYKNTISNGGFFNIAARLARYTGNGTYANWAETTWDWVAAMGLFSDTYQFFDGTDENNNCSNVNHIQWSYNAGIFLMGAANMYNYTDGDEVWKSRVEGILKGINIFVKNNVLYEVACEEAETCNVDQQSFKGYLARWMGVTAKIAPFSYDTIMPILRTSAEGAARQCTGPDNACGLRWTEPVFDGKVGVGEQMSATEIFQVNLLDTVGGPVTQKDGGISEGDPSAGIDTEATVKQFDIITTGDRVGAGFVTSIILLCMFGGVWWMVS
ncbi:hydrolase 76 protein [Arachnomyces sp. PD_36]|nr:hydrolase 76 protein [Arachnomyces sp. PD_36]